MAAYCKNPKCKTPTQCLVAKSLKEDYVKFKHDPIKNEGGVAFHRICRNRRKSKMVTKMSKSRL